NRRLRTQNFFRRPDSVVESLLEQRHSAQISISEVNPTVWISSSAPRLAPDESRFRPNHRMAPSHHIEPFRQPADVGMSVAEIGQRYVGPVRPARRHKPLPGLARISVDERIVVGKYRRAPVESSLMCGHNITERGAFVEYIVPRQWESACFGPIFE